MDWLIYFQLFTFTAGTLLYLFLAVLLGGLRKVRLPESLLFFGWIGMFLFYAGGLLALNVVFEFHAPPPMTLLVAFTLAVKGLVIAPPLLLHAHIEFLARLEGRRSRWMTPLAVAFYLPAAFFAAVFLSALGSQGLFEALDTIVAPSWRTGYAVWLVLAMAAAAWLELKLARRGDAEHARAGRILAGLLLLGVALSVAAVARGGAGAADDALQVIIHLLIFVPVLAGALLTYFAVRQSLRGTGFPRSLVYSVVLAFVALLYLTLARRLSVWLTPLGLPPEATVSVALFVFVLFLWPLQRWVGNLLGRAFRQQAEKFQQLVAEIQQVARAGNLEEFVSFTESRICAELDRAAVRVQLRDGPERPAPQVPPSIRMARFGVVEACYYGQTLSGETQAALEYLGEQLPAALDLCRLLEEKVEREREAAQRERLALLGEAAASLSHSLRNPLGSMKMMLQLQIEKPELSPDIRAELDRALGDIERLTKQVNRILTYVRSDTVVTTNEPGRMDLAALVERAMEAWRYTAAQRRIRLEVEKGTAAIRVMGREDALAEVLDNLLGNAFDAVAEGGRIRISLRAENGQVRLCVTDDGPGIPAGNRERIFELLYTTKPSGTGLGLAIAKKHLAAAGGTIACESPVEDGHGTRFTVTLPAL